ncbi:MAG: sigma-70 family RNA polymerase sigma factor [Myxococcota bacterium]
MSADPREGRIGGDGQTSARRDPVADRVAALHRAHYGALVAPLVRMLENFAAAEDVAQETFARALVAWRRDGLPDQPRAWLFRTAKNHALDRRRRAGRWRAREAALRGSADAQRDVAGADDFWGRADDDALRLIFTCCHPSLSEEARVALTLRTVCGLTSEQVARAFLIQTGTLRQRLVRAQRKIDAAKIPYVVPGDSDLSERTSAVLRTVYLLFNEGYARPGDPEARRLCEEAIRLGRRLIALLPGPSGAEGLLALLLLQHARYEARAAAGGELVTLEAQDRTLWDRVAIDEARPLVEVALRARPPLPFAIEAAIAALHAHATRPEDTDWPQIAALYAVLAVDGNPVVALNHAIAVAMAGDVAGGLARLEQLAPQLPHYHLLPAARADLWRRQGAPEKARRAYREALALAPDGPDRRFLERRLRALGPDPEEKWEKDLRAVDETGARSSSR